jgi:serine/threonine protein kinase
MMRPSPEDAPMPDDTRPASPRPATDPDPSIAHLALVSGEAPTPDTVPPPRFSPPSPDPIDPHALPPGPAGYELLAEVGRGGMGAVYRARDAGLDRDVAVKILLDWFPADGPAARRFEEEARITGQLQHPGIPAVHQVGTLPDGRPYLAMKLIKGQTLDARLKERADPAADRGRFLAIFEKVCEAVAYAHSRGVIHRDLKPANVMVGAFGEVQVMDWGLAKVLGGLAATRSGADDPDATLGTEIRSTRDADSATQAGSLLGTPAYMPPEQAIGAVDEIDARSDVFGLGGILCAILTGKPPYVGETAESTRRLAARGMLDDALARLAACGAEPGLLDLARRCLAAEKAARPADAGAVAAEVARLRADAEQRARRAELSQAEAAVRAAEERKRRRAVAWSAAAVAAVLAAGAGVSGWQLIRARDEAANARAAEGLARDEEQKARAAEAAAKASEANAIEREKAEKKAREEEKAARERAEAVTAFMQEVFAPGSAGQVGLPATVKKDLTVKEAMDYAMKTIAEQYKLHPNLEAGIRASAARTYADLGYYPEAEAALKRAMALLEKSSGPDHYNTLNVVNNLATLHMRKREHAAAEPLYKRALAGFEKTFGPDNPYTLTAVDNLAILYFTRGDYAAAEPLFKRAVAGSEKAHGPDHPLALTSLGPLGLLYCERGDFAAAEPLFKRAVAGYERAFGPDHLRTLASLDDLADFYLAKGEYAAAEPLYRRVLAGREKVRAADHPDVLASTISLGRLHLVAGRSADAVPLLERAVAGLAKRPELAGVVPPVRADLGMALLGTGKPAAAEPHLLAGYDGLTKQKSLNRMNRIRLRTATQGLVELYEAAKRPAKAAAWRAKLAALPPEVAPRPRPAG